MLYVLTFPRFQFIEYLRIFLIFLSAESNVDAEGGSGGVDYGPSRAGAAAALARLFTEKQKPPKSAGSSSTSKSGGGGGGGGDASKYKQIFKKYEMMMKLGINVHGAVGRMRQDGIGKDVIAAFEKKHGGL